MICTQAELADILGVAVKTIVDWQNNEGLPALETGRRGVGNSYETSTVIRWWLDRELGRASMLRPKDRLDSLKADREELALARDLQELAPIADVTRVWSDHIQTCRTELLQLPDVLAMEIYARHQFHVDPLLIRDHVEAALMRLVKLEDDDESDAVRAESASA